MWKALGFKESPYNTSPLSARAEDVDLLVGRESEALEFCTQLDSSPNGVLILSGAPGVGKTSFFNVQQYKLETQTTPFGPKILAARQLCPVQPGDDVRALALRALDSLCRSVEQWCLANGASVPKQTKSIAKWAKGHANQGFELGIDIMGFGGSYGRSVELPSPADATFESLSDALSAVTAEAIAVLKFQSVVVALDNLENLDDSDLGSLLISFRDTLFSIPHIWWVLIGQSGLGSLVQSLDPRVFERTSGSGIEIRPIELEELDQAISLRVTKFHSSRVGNSPLTQETHRRLFEASFGEMRFVFKYSNSICTKFVEKVRGSVLGAVEKEAQGANLKAKLETALNAAIGNRMINAQIPDNIATTHLREIIESELAGLFLKPKEMKVLQLVGDKGVARAKDFRDFSVRSMQDFSSNYLTKLYRQKLLVREQEGTAVKYRLRGIALLSHRFGILAST